MIEYKGYVGVFEFEPDAEQFAGHVEGIRGSITFYGKSVIELKREMAKSVDEYLAFCDERGIEPAKPYSGRFNVRMEPEQHRAIALAAASSGQSMNDWVVATLAGAIQTGDVFKITAGLATKAPVRRRGKAAKVARSARSGQR